MLEQIFGGLSLRQILFALSTLIVFVGVALLVRFLLVKVVKKYIQKTKTNLDDEIFFVLRKPLIAIVLLIGLYLAAFSLPQEIAACSYATKILALLLSLSGIYIVLVLTKTLIKGYQRNVAAKKKDVGFSLHLLNVCWFMMLVLAAWLAVIAALGIWGLEVSKATNWLGVQGWRVALIIGLAMLVVIVIGETVPKIVVRTLNCRPDEKKEEVQKRSDTLSKVLVTTIQVFVILVSFFMILSELGIDIAPMLAGAGVVGIAIGFGAQGLVKDLVAGLFVIMENHYCVGDVVKVADVAGVVENINLRRTVLRDLDGIVHVVPNGEIRVASNYTKGVSKVNLNVSVAYKEDLDHVISVINRVGHELTEDPAWKKIILKAPQVLRVDNLGESGIEIKITGDTQPIKQWEVTGELRLRLKKAFDEEGIEIPWPHTKVFFGNTPSISTPTAKDKL